MSTKKIALTVSLVLTLLLAAPALATTYYVTPDGNCDANCLRWDTACETIQCAINKASAGDKICVKEGTYTLTSSININKAVTIEGGYTGNGLDRDWETNETIVDGNNSVRCFTVTADDCNIDGFTICKGRENAGGGMDIDDEVIGVTVSNCTFSENEDTLYGGGAMYISWDASATLTNCVFKKNIGTTGGGIYYAGGHADITNCVFSKNTANGQGGAICYNSGSSTLKNCVFTQNDANDDDGGGVYLSDISPTFINCTFSKNTATDEGGGMYIDYCSCPTLTNCIFWQNDANDGDQIYKEPEGCATVTYSDIQGGYSGTGNINADPNFVDANDPNGPDNIWKTSDDGLHPIYSRCIDSANGNVEPSTDVCGASRFDHPDWSNIGIGSPDYVDMGAYESPVPAFVVLDSSGSAVALFDDSGNLYLKGTLDVNTTHTATAADEFRFQDSSSNDVGIIDANDGNMYIDGTLSENQGTLNPSTADDNFIIKDASGGVVAYIDDSGNLYLKGALYEQVLN